MRRRSNEDRTFYVYVDWTREATPRPFYVGKGTDVRVRDIRRNGDHKAVMREHGIDRRISLATCDEEAAFDLEIKLIAGLHTWFRDPQHNGIGCNLTEGGDGVAGINERFVEQYAGDTLVKTYNSFRELAEAFGVTPATVSNAISRRGVFPVAMRGFTWRVVHSRRKQTRANHGNSMPIVQLDIVTLNVIREYVSITEAVKATGVRYALFSNALRSKDQKHAVRLEALTGTKWAFKSVQHVKCRTQSSSVSPTGSKPIVVTYDDGGEVTYPSVAAASRDMGVNANKVLAALHDGKLIAGFGVKFQDPNDNEKRVVRSNEWLSSIAHVNGMSVQKLDEHGNVVRVYSSFADAERSEEFLNRELYSALSRDECVMLGGFTWRRAS